MLPFQVWPPARSSSISSSSIAERDLFLCHSGSDIQIRCGDHLWPAHRYVLNLAHSPIFADASNPNIEIVHHNLLRPDFRCHHPQIVDLSNEKWFLVRFVLQFLYTHAYTCAYRKPTFDADNDREEANWTADVPWDDPIKVHASMYEIAKRYELDGLRATAERALYEAVRHADDQELFSEQAREAWVVRPRYAKILREVILDFVMEKHSVLFGDANFWPYFHEVLDNLPGFPAVVARRLASQLHFPQDEVSRVNLQPHREDCGCISCGDH